MRSEFPRRSVRAFSLIEVAIAVAVFAVAVAGVLGVLAGMSNRTRERRDLRIAQGLGDAIRVELRRAATPSFDDLAAGIPVATPPAGPGLALVASRDGLRLGLRDAPTPPGDSTVPVNEQYFLIECWRFPAGDLAYASSSALLALQVRISWPYRVPLSGTPVALEQRHALLGVCSLVR